MFTVTLSHDDSHISVSGQSDTADRIEAIKQVGLAKLGHELLTKVEYIAVRDVFLVTFLNRDGNTYSPTYVTIVDPA